MDGKRQLIVLGPALLAALALGSVSFSSASATPDPEQTVTTSTPKKAAVDPSPSTSAEDPRGYWQGYRDGYRAAAQDCRRRARSFAGPPSDYDRGWLDGFDSGFARFCWTSN
ncbi:hypothetical protein [Streptosporangium sp. NPDC002721]|uniref:hypothetical protein n=1 Tax=Streptosporangium sp. NPDC002721 TaxID=3366188 RepID=UPI00367B28E4